MAQYILLLRLDPHGRQQTLQNPRNLIEAAEAVEVDGVDWLGLYGVLGQYDFVCIVDAPGNDAIARYSLELGVRAGATIETLPAVPIGLLEGTKRPKVSSGAPEREPAVY